jgi:hypothetical protein
MANAHQKALIKVIKGLSLDSNSVWDMDSQIFQLKQRNSKDSHSYVKCRERIIHQ